MSLIFRRKGSINFAMVYVHRYLRLTPILAVVILISLTLFRRVMGDFILIWSMFDLILTPFLFFKMGSGPLWFSYIKNAVNCDEYWWTSLLYIQNYYNPDKIVTINELYPWKMVWRCTSNLNDFVVCCFSVSRSHVVSLCGHATICVRSIGQLFVVSPWKCYCCNSRCFGCSLCWLDILALCTFQFGQSILEP